MYIRLNNMLNLSTHEFFDAFNLKSIIITVPRLGYPERNTKSDGRWFVGYISPSMSGWAANDSLQYSESKKTLNFTDEADIKIY